MGFGRHIHNFSFLSYFIILMDVNFFRGIHNGRAATASMHTLWIELMLMKSFVVLQRDAVGHQEVGDEAGGATANSEANYERVD